MPKFPKNTSAFKMKGYEYPGVSPVKKWEHFPEGYDPTFGGQKVRRGTAPKVETKDTSGMKDITLDRNFDMDRWVK